MLYVEFTDRTDTVTSQLGKFVGDLVMDRGWNTSIQPGEQNLWSLYLPVSFSLFAELEEARQGLNLSFQINLSCTLIERPTEGITASEIRSVEISGVIGSTQFIQVVVAKSEWGDLSKTLGYSGEEVATRKTYIQMLEDIRKAKEQAEQWAADAKLASMVTADKTLATVHEVEEKKLRTGVIRWMLSTFACVAAVIGLFIYFFFQHLGIAETILRIAALSFTFYGLTACLRMYKSFKQLELQSRHRANIGRTFGAMLAAQPSDEAKNVLAGITAHQMVNFGGSGFAGKDADEQQMSAVLEVLKSLFETKKAP